MAKSKKKKNSPKAAAAAAAVREIKPQSMPALLWGILAAGFLVRLVYIFMSRGNPYFAPEILDARYYHEWALKILSGKGWGQGVFYGLPLYPLFLAACYKISSGSVLFVKIVQATGGTATLFFIYKIARFISNEKSALAAAALAALYGPLFFHESIFIPESIGIPLYAAALYAALLFADAPSIKRGLILGVLSGLATLTKAGAMLFIILFAAAMIFHAVRRSKPFLPAAAVLLAFFLTLAPVTLHNWIYGKDFVLLTSHGGFNFYIGNNASATGVFTAPEGTGTNVESQIRDSEAVAEREVGRPLKPSEVSKYWSGKAWEFIRENPGQALQLWGKKLVLFFDAREISDVDDYQFGAKLNPMLKLPWLNFAVIGPLFLLGLLGCLGGVKHKNVILLWVLSYMSAIAGFFINARYRLPLLSAIIVLAGIALIQVWESIREKKWARVSVQAVLLIAAVAVTQLQLVGTDWIRDYINTGDIYFQKNQNTEAEAYFKEALKINPDSARANLGMGVLCSKTGRPEDAKNYYELVLKENPSSDQALTNLGYYYIGQGDLDQAERYLLKAIAAKPNAYQAYTNLGLIYGKRGEDDKATEAFQRSLAIKPDNARVLTNLGLMMLKKGDRQGARDYWEKAVEIDPQSDARTALERLDRS